MHLDFFSHLSLCPGIIAHVHKQTILSVCDGSLDIVVLLVLVFFPEFFLVSAQRLSEDSGVMNFRSKNGRFKPQKCGGPIFTINE